MKVGHRKILTVLGGALAFGLLVLLLAPVFIREPLARATRAGVNRAVDAQVDWRNASLSLLRDFPDATLSLEELSVVGTGTFEGDTLATVGRLRLVLDLRSALASALRGGQLRIRSVELDRPVLDLRVLENGVANWQIAKSAGPGDDEPAAYDVALRAFRVEGGRVALDNRQIGLFAELAGLDVSLDGDFTRDRVVLRNRTHADEATLRFAGVPYLNRVALDIATSVDADMANGRFQLQDTEVRLNELALALSGAVQRAGDDVDLDLHFEAPRSEFREILSLVPAVYMQDFAGLQATGTMSVGGRIQGRYGKAAFPAFEVLARVDDGTFRYPDLPLPARDIALDLAIRNPGHDVDSTVIDLKRLQLEIGGESITGSLVMRTPVSDPDIDFKLQGRIDLEAAARTVKLEGIDTLAGTIDADVAVRARLSDIDHARYDRVRAGGTVAVHDMTVQGSELPRPLGIDELLLSFSPQYVEVPSFSGRIGSSDIRARGRLDNLIGYVLRDDVLRGSASVSSRSFKLDEWRSDDSELQAVNVPGGIDFTLDADIAGLEFDGLQMSNARGRVRVADRRATLEGFRVETLGGALALTGSYSTPTGARPAFDLSLTAEELNIPAAFAQLATVERFAPVARYATGSFSGAFQLAGELGPDLMPVFDAVNGRGSLLTSRIALADFPPLQQLANVLRLQALASPTLEAIRTSFAIRDGRLHVTPFEVRLGESSMRVAGSNGIDQSLDYTLTLRVPRSLLGDEADRVVTGLAAQAGRAGLQLQPSDVVELAVQLGGTIRDPVVRPQFSGVAASLRAGVEDAVGRAVEQRLDDAAQRVDEVREEARRRAQADAERIVREAEERAAALRAEAAALAEAVRTEGYRQADELLERATSPIARAAAQPAANRLRRETDARADQIVAEADRRAGGLVEEARTRAEALLAAPG